MTLSEELTRRGFVNQTAHNRFKSYGYLDFLRDIGYLPLRRGKAFKDSALVELEG